MSTSERRAPPLRFVRWLLQSVLVMSSGVAIRVLVYLAFADFGRDPRYVLGCFEGLGVDLAIGMVASSPLLVELGGMEALALLLPALALLADAAGEHYHTVFWHLPTRSTLVYLRDLHLLESSIREHAPLPLVLAEGLVPAIASFLLSRRLAPRASRLLFSVGRGSVLVAAFGTVSLASLVRASGLEGQEHYGAIGPLLHLALREPGPAFGGIGEQEVPEVLSAVQHALSTDNPGPAAAPEYPFCTREKASERVPSRKSAVLLILESVDTRALRLELDGRAVMPNLRRMAEDGVSFGRVFATGNMSVHSLPALFGGLPAVPGRALLLRSPVAHVLGLPRVLHGHGYETRYLHAADLSFSHQREFLSELGFDRIDPMPPGAARYGWGAADGVLFDRLRALLEGRAASGPPLFATAFTVSTHDPYDLPPEHHRAFHGDTPFDRFAEALSYLDDELGRFYDWFRREQAPRGTLLLVTGDHAPRVPFPGDPSDTTTGEFEYRFEVPLVLLGLPDGELARARSRAKHVTASHADVPATLSAALGIAPPRCQEGRNLLAEAPAERLVTSIAGESLEFVYAHTGDRRFLLDLRSGRLSEHDLERDPTFRRDLAPLDPAAPRVRLILRSYLDLMGFLADHDAFAPKESEARARAAVPTPSAPLQLTRVPARAEANDSKVLPAIERLVTSGAEWVAISVEPGAGGGPVVRTGPDSTPLEEVLARFAPRTGFLIDLDRPKEVTAILQLVHGTVRALGQYPEKSHFMIASPDDVLLTTVRQFSTWPLVHRRTSRDANEAALRFALEKGFDWVAFPSETIDAALVRGAHASGVRVLAEGTSGSPAWDGEGPDGVLR